MIDLDFAKDTILEERIMEYGNRNYTRTIILLFGTLGEEQYASVNFFIDALESFGLVSDENDAKAVRTKFGQMTSRWLEKIALSDLLEEDRKKICENVAGRVSHNGVKRTRSIFKLNTRGREALAKIKTELLPKNQAPMIVINP